MQGKLIALLAGAAIALVSLSYAQRQSETPSWAPKPVQPTKYVPPQKPHTKIAEVKAAHAGQKDWRQLVVDDDHLRAEYIGSSPGSKTPRRFHPDTREWWVILEGQIRFSIEGQEPFVATKNSMVQ